QEGNEERDERSDRYAATEIQTTIMMPQPHVWMIAALRPPLVSARATRRGALCATRWPAVGEGGRCHEPSCLHVEDCGRDRGTGARTPEARPRVREPERDDQRRDYRHPRRQQEPSHLDVARPRAGS